MMEKFILIIVNYLGELALKPLLEAMVLSCLLFPLIMKSGGVTLNHLI